MLQKNKINIFRAEEKKGSSKQTPVAEKKPLERRPLTKENKEPKEKETKANNNKEEQDKDKESKEQKEPQSKVQIYQCWSNLRSIGRDWGTFLWRRGALCDEIQYLCMGAFRGVFCLHIVVNE